MNRPVAFQDRAEAARLLADRLAAYRGRDPLVLGIPRGALPMAEVIADALQGDLDVVLVHKLGAPGNPEYAIGSVSEAGDVSLSDAAEWLGLERSEVEAEARRQVDLLRERRRAYAPIRPPLDPAGRITIVVDDGSATGSTMLAALQAVRQRHPARLIAALAVAPPDTVDRLRERADEVVVLEAPAAFYAVGQFFADFGQVSDADVVRVLRRAAARGAPSPE